MFLKSCRWTPRGHLRTMLLPATPMAPAPTNPRSSQRWYFFKISATRHGVINWEEFWEKISGSFCTANEARKWAEHFAWFFAQFFAQTSARVIKTSRSGKVRRNQWYQRNFAQPRLSSVEARSSPARGYKFGCVCSHMAGHEDAGVVTGHIGTNTPPICTPSLGTTALWPYSNGGCANSGGFWSSLRISRTFWCDLPQNPCFIR